MEGIVAPNSLELVSRKQNAPDQHPVLTYLASLALGSRRTMKQALETVASILTQQQVNALDLDWSLIRYQHVQLVRSVLAEKFKSSTANKMLSALKGTLKECWRLGYMSVEDYQRATDIQPVRGPSIPKGRSLSSGEVTSIMKTCGNDNSISGARDAAIMAIAVSCGLRRAEIVEIDLQDLDLTTGALKIRGKGNKERIVYLVNGALSAVEEWLHIRGNEPGAFFVPIQKNEKIVFRKMSDQAIYSILRNRAKESSIQNVSPHDLRRTFVSDLLDAGADISSVQQLAGHASVNTTQRYDRRGERAKRKATELLHVPFFPRNST